MVAQLLTAVLKPLSSVAQLASASDCYPFRLMAYQEVESSSLSGGDDNFLANFASTLDAIVLLRTVGARNAGSAAGWVLFLDGQTVGLDAERWALVLPKKPGASSR
jgi:hypothetical protein